MSNDGYIDMGKVLGEQQFTFEPDEDSKDSKDLTYGKASIDIPMTREGYDNFMRMYKGAQTSEGFVAFNTVDDPITKDLVTKATQDIAALFGVYPGHLHWQWKVRCVGAFNRVMNVEDYRPTMGLPRYLYLIGTTMRR